ncbi:hypothetical protein [Lysobacter sp. CA199]|uniref:hypothetical protein n=1 Tax=Lysobacter sp. CA199 TaxID=3455608 RepID=UPI003F8CF532
MTQRQISHETNLPPCADGHAARHMRDHRCATAGGGHFLECECRRTVRHANVELALVDWKTINQVQADPAIQADPIIKERRTRTRKKKTPVPVPAASADVLQFALFQRSDNS